MEMFLPGVDKLKREKRWLARGGAGAQGFLVARGPIDLFGENGRPN